MICFWLAWLPSPNTVLFSQSPQIEHLEAALQRQTETDSINHYLKKLALANIGTSPAIARGYAKEMVTLGKKSENYKSLASAHHLVAATYYYQGVLDSASLHLDTLEKLLVGRNHPDIAMPGIVLRAALYTDNGNFEEAIKQNLIALEISREINDERAESTILTNLGNAYMHLSKPYKALEYLWQSKSIKSPQGNYASLAVLHHNIGDLYVGLENYDSATFYLNRALDYHQLGANESQMALTYSSLGTLYQNIGQPDSSERYLRLALTNSLKFKHHRHTIVARNRLGQQLAQMERFEEGRTLLELAYQESKIMGFSDYQMENRRRFAELEAKAGNHKQSVIYFREYIELKDSLFHEELSEKVAYYQEKFNAEDRELEIAHLAQAKAENEAKISRQKFWTLITISGLLLAVLLGGFALVIYFRSLKSNRSLNVKNQIISDQNDELTIKNTKLGESLPMNIIVAEDDEVNQMIAMRMFSNLAFHPVFASNGREALALCARATYDLVFIDVNMPEMGGIEATKLLHAEYAKEHRPLVIAMTANTVEGNREACLQAGMDDYIAKPFRIDQLRDILLKYGLKKKEREAALVVEQMKSKEQDLNQIAFHLSEKRKFILEISTRLQTLQQEPSETVKSEISSLIREFNSHRQLDRNAEALQSDIDKVNVSFYNRLQAQFPMLTENEKELCGLLVLKLSTKDIASLRNVTTNAIKKARQRVRRKLSLLEEQDLTVFLEHI